MKEFSQRWVVGIPIVTLIIALIYSFKVVSYHKEQHMRNKSNRKQFTAYIEGFVAGRLSATNTNSYFVMSNMLNTVSNKYVK